MNDTVLRQSWGLVDRPQVMAEWAACQLALWGNPTARWVGPSCNRRHLASPNGAPWAGVGLDTSENPSQVHWMCILRAQQGGCGALDTPLL